MKFNFDWWYTYIYKGNNSQRDNALNFLTSSVLEAEIESQYISCTIPYNRQDCKSLYGIARMCYESLEGLSLPAQNYQLGTLEHWWIPTNIPQMICNLSLLPSTLVYSTFIQELLRINKLDKHPGSWLSLLLGTETYYFSVEFTPIDQLVWNEQGLPTLIQGDKCILGSLTPTEGSYTLMLSYHTREEVTGLMQQILARDFNIPIPQQHSMSAYLDVTSIAVSKNHIMRVLGYIPPLTYLQMYLDKEDSDTLWYAIPKYYQHLKEDIDIIEEISIRSMEFIHLSAPPKEINPPRTLRNLAKLMSLRGYYEVKNFGMITEAAALKYRTSNLQEPVYLSNPMSQEGAVMRTSLIPGLLKNLTFNINHVQRKVHIFEIGKIFDHNREVTCLAALAYGSKQHDIHKVPNSFSELLGDLHVIIDASEIELRESNILWLNSKMSKSIWLQDRCIGYIGQLSSTGYHHKYLSTIVHQTYKKHIISGNPFVFHIEIEDLPKVEVVIHSIPNLPSIYRDINITCLRDTPLSRVIHAINEKHIPYLTKVTLKDTYYGSDEQKKFTFELEFYLPNILNKSQLVSQYMEDLESISFIESAKD